MSGPLTQPYCIVVKGKKHPELQISHIVRFQLEHAARLHLRGSAFAYEFYLGKGETINGAGQKDQPYESTILLACVGNARSKWCDLGWGRFMRGCTPHGVFDLYYVSITFLSCPVHPMGVRSQRSHS